MFSELLARKVGVSEWVLQQEPKCLGKLLQVLLRAVSLMDIFMKMQPPVSFSEGLPLPNFICESLHPMRLMKEQDAWNWGEVCALVCACVRRAVPLLDWRRGGPTERTCEGVL